ncbi:tape measure protein [Pseudomonas aeruginosa]|uniref:tape measure protein n=1 Tax=Pseudomonas aeruginosa TaxID=287 RepID=UPI003AAF42CE
MPPSASGARDRAVAASIKAAALGLGALFSIREIIQTTDAWTNLQNRLRLVTSTQAQLAAVTADVYRIAQLTSSALDSTATVYQRFAQNADRLNISQRQVASLTDTVAKSIAISGASAQSAEAALVQFGQALASGVLRGEEFNSVSEQAPALLKAIADGLNVNIGELRKMANEGQLTADVLVDALSNAAAGVNDQFATSIKTVSMAVQELENAFTRLVGEFTNGRGAGEALAGAISGVANVMDGLSDNAELLGTALDAVMVTAAGRAVAAITGVISTTWLSNAETCQSRRSHRRRSESNGRRRRRRGGTASRCPGATTGQGRCRLGRGRGGRQPRPPGRQSPEPSGRPGRSGCGAHAGAGPASGADHRYWSAAVPRSPG